MMKGFFAVFLCVLVVGCSSTKPIHYSGAELSARGASEYCDDNTAAMNEAVSMTNVDGKTIALNSK